MKHDMFSYPPATHVLRPERHLKEPGRLEKTVHWLAGPPLRFRYSRLGRYRRVLPLIHREGSRIADLDDAGLRKMAAEYGMRMRGDGITDDHVAGAFACIREAAGRTLGMRHFDCQLIGGLVMLRGLVAEMATGEGKTLTATLAAGAMALAGIPVHVITVNDYLAARDAEQMAPVYRLLGLSVGTVIHDADTPQRREAYGCDITYCTNKELVFDYLRDRIVLGDREDPMLLQTEHLFGRDARSDQVVLRGLHFGIVDEADSILIDEARTPLIISRRTGSEEEKRFMQQALEIAHDMKEDVDYRLDKSSRSVELTAQGRDSLPGRTRELGPLWTGSVRREEVIRQALSALHLFRHDEQYIIRDGKIEIVDEFTGRTMPDRSWERGLHQLIELKEGCEMTQRQETQAKISYQRFFRKYLHLSGMTGTGSEVADELWSVYGLPVIRIPTNRPSRRVHLEDSVFPSNDAKWDAIMNRIRILHDAGHPVLVGTRTIEASELLSAMLSAAGLDHQVLNARHEKEEAEIVARAGEYGRITIATNMAGRGTDIKLEQRVADMQGLHVILTEFHEARRIDRQLIGRCARQGDPGAYEAILALDDPLIESGGSSAMRQLAASMLRVSKILGRRLGILAIRSAQKKVERLHAAIRKQMFDIDQKHVELMSFSGRPE